MREATFVLGQSVRFADDDLSWTVMAKSDRYTILTAMGPSDEDYPELDGMIYYTIVDHVLGKRGPHNIIFNNYDFATAEGCHECLCDLVNGEIEVSKRTSRIVDLVVTCADWTYDEGCGCVVTFFAESGYHTSRLLPGQNCTDHTKRHQVAERECLMERAKKSLSEFQSGTATK